MSRRNLVIAGSILALLVANVFVLVLRGGNGGSGRPGGGHSDAAKGAGAGDSGAGARAGSGGGSDPYGEDERDRTMTGTLTLIDHSGYATVGNACWGDGAYSDLREGASVVVRTGSGVTLGTSELGPGVRRGPQGAGVEILSLGCTFDFVIGPLQRAESYVVIVGGRPSDTSPYHELADDAWKVALSLGCTQSDRPAERISVEPPSRVYLTAEDRRSRSTC